MHSQLDNGEIVIAYADGTAARLPLHNPTTWWPIDADYDTLLDGFCIPGPYPPRGGGLPTALEAVSFSEFAYEDGTVEQAEPDKDVTVETVYNADGLVAELEAQNPTTGAQTTYYVHREPRQRHGGRRQRGQRGGLRVQ